mgnify:CR=1 FL=1
MGKSQWDRWRGMGEFRERMDRMLEEAMRDMMGEAACGPGFVWVPLADVFETPEALVARVELPGVQPDDLVVEAADGELVIRGERAQDAQAQEAAFHLMERTHGPFARRFPLPREADGAAITAILKDGLLTVTVPKRARPQPGPLRVTIG